LAGGDLDQALHAGVHPNLTILPAGVPRRQAIDLAGSDRMAALLHELRDRFDVVIVDTPPLLVASDALALAKDADGVVLGARIDPASRGALERAALVLRRAGGNLLGPVMTGMRADRHRAAAPARTPAEPTAVG